MSKLNNDIERLIVRHLDSELTADEELGLSRELIRNPDARQMLEDYEQADALAVAALNSVITESRECDPTALPVRAQPVRRAGYLRAWWVIPGAVAAAILALLVPNPSVVPHTNEPVVVSHTKSHTKLQPPERIALPQTGDVTDIMQNASTHSGTRIQRKTGREVFGVVGDDGNIYWIQVDRIRTVRQPRRSTVARSPNEVM
jgi:hypothetical protein